MKSDRKICVGQIAGAHGVRGLVRLRSFTEDPESLLGFKDLTDESGARSFDVKLKGMAKDFFIAEVKGLNNKEEADALRGTKLYVPRAALPKTSKAEYYESDLIGLAVKDKEGRSHGEVLGVHNYGAGPFLEIGKAKGSSFMLPFTNACVPEVDVKNGDLIVEIPADWLNAPKKNEA